ncbi:MAG: hypothetical protein HY962_09825 [Ignavibacteriae bacterium]|nr:hypothetical protein [Ignavibacteriota bacterium]
MRYRLIVFLVLLQHCLARCASAQSFERVSPSWRMDDILDIMITHDGQMHLTTSNAGHLTSTDAGTTWKEQRGPEKMYDLIRLVEHAGSMWGLPAGSFPTGEKADSAGSKLLLRYDPSSDEWWSIRFHHNWQGCTSADMSGDGKALFLLLNCDSLVLFRSVDAAATWMRIPLPRQWAHSATNWWRPAAVFRDSATGIVMHYDGHTGWMYQTTDAGATWMPVAEATDIRYGLEGVPRPPVSWCGDSVFVFIDQGNVAVSTTDLGRTWRRGARIQGTVRAIAFDDGGRGYAVDARGAVHRSEDYGIHWVRVLEGSQLDIRATVCLAGRDSLLFGTNFGQLRRSTDAGLTWTWQRDAPVLQPQKAWFPDAMNGFLVGAALDAAWTPSILKTTDGGSSWSVLALPDSVTVAMMFFADATHGWIVDERRGRDDTVRTVYRSTDGGVSWIPVLNWPIIGGKDITILATGTFHRGRNIIILPTYEGGLLRTGDGGLTWSYTTGVFDTSGGDSAPGAVVTNGNTHMWIATQRRIYRSTDDGITWSIRQSTQNLDPQRTIRRLFPLGEDSIARMACSTSCRMHVTPDGGTTWQVYDMDPSFRSVVPSMTMHGDGTGMLTPMNFTSVNGICADSLTMTVDGWKTRYRPAWEIRSTRGTQVDNSIKLFHSLDRNHTWLFTPAAVYRTTNGGVNWTELPPAVPSTADIAEVYPQPAAPNDVLHVRLRNDAGALRLELRDLLGRLVSVLHDGERADRGTVRWNVDVPAGVYILSLASRSRARARTIIVR